MGEGLGAEGVGGGSVYSVGDAALSERTSQIKEKLNVWIVIFNKNFIGEIVSVANFATAGKNEEQLALAIDIGGILRQFGADFQAFVEFFLRGGIGLDLAQNAAAKV